MKVSQDSDFRNPFFKGYRGDTAQDSTHENRKNTDTF